MIRAVAVTVCALVLGPASAAGAAELLPRPDALEPNVRFWSRIYSEVDGRAGLIHDAVHLDVVYETLRLPPGLSARAQERHVERIKKRYRAALRKLATGRRSGLTPEEERVLGRWPEGTTNATFRSAARNVRFQLGQADKFRAGLVRSGAWRDYIEEVLRQRGVPEQLVALPHVESSYNPHAYSRVGAAGLWQFTRSTGRRYLRIDHVVDERLDPERATVAAARLLADNYRSLQSWPLAITAYNHGSSGMRRAVRKLGTRDIGSIVQRYRSRTFGFASRNFYASFLAAIEVDQHAELYFGPLELDEPVAYATVVLDHYYPVSSLGRALGIDRETLRQHNLSLRPSVWNGSKYLPRGYELRVPSDRLTEEPEVALQSVPLDERFARQHRDRYYKVRRGDTLSKIARRYGVRERELVALNNLRSRHRIHAGQVLVLPDAAGRGVVRVEREEPPPDGIYRVRRGDTLGLIARRFGTTEAQLVADNGLRNRHRIAVGQRLRLPGAAPDLVAAADGAGEAPAAASPPAEPEPAAEAPAEAIVVVARAASDPAAAAEPVAETDGDPRDADAADAPEIFVPLPEAAADPLPTAGADAEVDGDEPPPHPVVAAVATAADDPPTPDPSNYAVTATQRITVQAEETLGHYAEWLEVPTQRLRGLNRMSRGTPLAIGQQVQLDFARVDPATFEERRLEYHQTLQAEFFASFVVADTETHVLRNGDTLWILAREKFEVPVWLLRQYNPDLDFRSLKAGTSMVIPVIEPRESQRGAG